MTQPPARLSANQLHAWIGIHIATGFDWHDPTYVCKTCGGQAQAQTLTISLHASEFGDACAGPGDAKSIGVPRCPTCEPGAPEFLATCIHEPMFAGLLQRGGVPPNGFRKGTN